MQAKATGNGQLALPLHLSDFMRPCLCPLPDGQTFHKLECVLGRCSSCSMQNCISLDPEEEGDNAKTFDLEYYGYTTSTDAEGRQRKYIEQKVSISKREVCQHHPTLWPAN